MLFLTTLRYENLMIPTQDYEVAVVYCNDNEKYLQTAREWTEKYATKEYISESEKLVGIDGLMVCMLTCRSISTFPSLAN